MLAWRGQAWFMAHALPAALTKPLLEMKGMMPNVAPAAAVTVSAMHATMAMLPPREAPIWDRPQQKAAAELCSR